MRWEMATGKSVQEEAVGCHLYVCCSAAAAVEGVPEQWLGCSDPLLSREGIAEAERKAALLAAVGVEFDAVCSSDLRRAARTAEVIARICCRRAGAGAAVNAATKAVSFDTRLRELNLGTLAGTFSSSNGVSGGACAGLLEKLGRLPHEERIRTAYLPGLETPCEVAARVLRCARDVALRSSGSTGGPPVVLLVTHQRVIQALLAVQFEKDHESIGVAPLAHLQIWLPTGGRGAPALEDAACVECINSPDAIPRRGGGNKSDIDNFSGDLLLRILLVTAFTTAAAGVLQLGLRADSEVASVRIGRIDGGWWGRATASVNWCEEDYTLSDYVAEWWNTLSSLLIALAGLGAGVRLKNAGAEAAYLLLCASLLAVGVGSVAFHATLQKEHQSLDEVPMLWLATIANYCLIVQRRTRRGLGDDMTTHQDGTAKSTKWDPWLPATMAVYAALVSVLQFFSEGLWQPIVFHISFATAEIIFLALSWVQSRRALDPRHRAMFNRAFALYGAGIACWATDIHACSSLQGMPYGFPNPQLHAWWHVLVATASYLLIIACATTRLIDRRLRASVTGGALPGICVLEAGEPIWRMRGR